MREFIGKNTLTLLVGPFLSSSDGITPIASYGLSDCDIAAIRKYANTTPVGIATNSWASVASLTGFYNLTLTNSQCDTLGPMTVTIQRSGAQLPFFEDILLVTSEHWNAKYGALPYATGAAVSSLDLRVQALPNSSTLSVLVGSLDARVNSGASQVNSVYARVSSNFALLGAVPTSATLNNHMATLPTSLTLNAHVTTLPTSGAVYTMIGSLDTRVASIGIQVGSVDQRALGARGDISSNYALLITLPTSSMFVDRVSSLDVRVQSVSAQVNSISTGGATDVTSIAFGVWDYGSRGLTYGAEGGGATATEVQSACAVVVEAYALHTLMNSSTLSARFALLPNSQTLNAHIITLPTSEMVHSEIVTLPNSAVLYSHVVTLPTSSTFYRTVSSMDARVASLQNISLTDVSSVIFGYAIETGLTFLQAQRAEKAFLLGIASGGGTNEVVFRDHLNLKSRVTMTVTSAGNRSAVTIDGD